MDITDALDCAASSLQMLGVAAHAYANGWGKVLNELGDCTLCYEDEYEFAMLGIESVCDFVEHKDSDGDDETAEFHLSTKAMMAYYRLCQRYEKLKRISQKNNPYRKRAEQKVREHLSQEGCYHIAYHLQVNPRGKWSNRIIFQYYISYFTEYLALFSQLLEIFAFYRDAAKELKREIKVMESKTKSEILPFPKIDKQKRRVA